MIGRHFAEDLPIGRVQRGLRVGPWSIDVLLDAPMGGGEAMSGDALRLAEDLVATSLGVAQGVVRVASLLPSGRPVTTMQGVPASCVVSVSHVRGLVGAVVSDAASVGLDIVDPADVGRSIDVWFTPDELALLPDDHGLLRTMLWSAKEAAYKAARLDTEFRPRRVTIESLSANGFEWRVRDGHTEASGAGCFATAGRYVIAIAATAAWQTGGSGEIAGSRTREPVACS
jgi:hypothetical protein